MNKLKFSNIRLGFATNSSSTHSVVILKKDEKVEDDTQDLYDKDNEIVYGWSFFKLASKKEKLLYLYFQLYNSCWFLPPVIRDQYIKEFIGYSLKEIDPEISTGVIDHQSEWKIPLKLRCGGGYYKINDIPNNNVCERNFYDFDKEFITDLKNYLLKENVCVFGGNDNVSDDDYVPDMCYGRNVGFFNNLKFLDERDIKNNIKFYKDNDYWIIFNKKNGNKIVFSFNEHAKERKFSTTPELIDLKITDLCKSNCWYCYQDSKCNGKHADYYAVKQLINDLSKFKSLFEIAIGGGEPTLHPSFFNILAKCRDNGIKVNFSTRNIKFLMDNHDKLNELEIGAIGFSVDENTSEEVLEKIKILRRDVGLNITIQIIPELINEEKLLAILDSDKLKYIEYVPILFLGLKKTGKIVLKNDYITQSINPNYKQVLYNILKDRHILWSLDTCLANEMKNELEELNANSISYYTEEGKYSCYIDAVNMRLSKSSYDCVYTQLPIIKDSYKSSNYDKIIAKEFSKWNQM